MSLTRNNSSTFSGIYIFESHVFNYSYNTVLTFFFGVLFLWNSCFQLFVSHFHNVLWRLYLCNSCFQLLLSHFFNVFWVFIFFSYFFPLSFPLAVSFVVQTEKCFLILVESNGNQTVFTIIRLFSFGSKINRKTVSKIQFWLI